MTRLKPNARPLTDHHYDTLSYPRLGFFLALVSEPKPEWVRATHKIGETNSLESKKARKQRSWMSESHSVTRSNSTQKKQKSREWYMTSKWPEKQPTKRNACILPENPLYSYSLLLPFPPIHTLAAIPPMVRIKKEKVNTSFIRFLLQKAINTYYEKRRKIFTLVTLRLLAQKAS